MFVLLITKCEENWEVSIIFIQYLVSLKSVNLFIILIFIVEPGRESTGEQQLANKFKKKKRTIGFREP
jgi:hypothetical protein